MEGCAQGLWSLPRWDGLAGYLRAWAPPAGILQPLEAERREGRRRDELDSHFGREHSMAPRRKAPHVLPSGQPHPRQTTGKGGPRNTPLSQC